MSDLHDARKAAKAVHAERKARLSGEPSIHDAAEALGLESYDTALPLRFAEKAESDLSYIEGVRCAGNLVWCYDDYPGGTFNMGGYPVAVTEMGRAILGSLALHARHGR